MGQELREPRERNVGPRCPLCHESLAVEVGEGALHGCPGCRTVFHRDCAEEMRGCSTLGCRMAGRPLRQYDSLKTLPFVPVRREEGQRSFVAQIGLRSLIGWALFLGVLIFLGLSAVEHYSEDPRELLETPWLLLVTPCAFALVYLVKRRLL